MRIREPDKISRSAVFSPCETYRYTLERFWGGGKVVVFVLLNPSTADAQHDDPTNRRGMGYARRWRFDGCVFVNLFAYRTPTPFVLKRAHEPIGPDNDHEIIRWCTAERTGMVVAAWGMNGTHMNRHAYVRSMLIENQVKAVCFGRTKNHQPKHILYLKATAGLEDYLS